MGEEEPNGEEQLEECTPAPGSQQTRNVRFQSNSRPGARPQPGTYANKRPDRKTRI